MKKVIESIDSKVLEKVCYITIDHEKNKLLFDCNGNAIKITARYTRAINMRYRKNIEKNGLRDEELSVVWILVGVKGEEKKILQVGRNCSLTRMLSSDIRKDVKEIIGDVPNSRYNNLCNGYNELIFYEIRISDFLENDSVFKEMFGGVPLEKIENSDLCSAYHTIRASYVEGKVAAIGMCKKMKKMMNKMMNKICGALLQEALMGIYIHIGQRIHDLKYRNKRKQFPIVLRVKFEVVKEIEMFIREYMSSDCERLAELFYQTVHTVNVKDYSQEQLCVWATGNVDLSVWNKSFLEHNTLVAIENSIIVGFGDIDNTGYLDRLYIHKDYQRQGIASALCDKLENGFTRITTHASITAKPFFLHRGYKLVNEQQVVRKGIYLTNYAMEK